MLDHAKACFEYETYHEGENKILRVYIEKCTFPPSIEYSEQCMAKLVDALMANSGVTIVILSQLREYEYDYSQTQLLNELGASVKAMASES